MIVILVPEMSYDIFKVIPTKTHLQDTRRTSMPTDSNSTVNVEQKRSILASDGVGLFQLSFEFNSNFDRNGPDRSALRRRNTVEITADDDKSATVNHLTRTIRRRLIRQSTSVQSDDSAFVDDLCCPTDDTCLPASKNYDSLRRFEELINQMSIESNDSAMHSENGFISSEMTKFRSASIDSGYLDTVSSVSSNICNEANDSLAIVEEDDLDHDIDFHDDDEDQLSEISSKLDSDEQFTDSFNETLNRLLKGRRDIFHVDDSIHQPISSRTLKRIIENVNFKSTSFYTHNNESNILFRSRNSCVTMTFPLAMKSVLIYGASYAITRTLRLTRCFIKNRSQICLRLGVRRVYSTSDLAI
jgi:hypothetical protein